jgi:EAL domain-containing protein (putative c-di-GMP-specific phosphodiesterase class I)
MRQPTMTPARPPAAEATSLSEIVAGRGLRSTYQPLVDLHSGQTVGYEALARAPLGSGLERPDLLFEAARVCGLEQETEWECQRAGLQGALDARLGSGLSLFLNVEPRLLAARRPAWLESLAQRAIGSFPLFVEFTERSLTDRPGELLAAASRLRGMGVGIALDDVGADPRSLALMPILAPDVIKLDLRLVQAHPSRQTADIVHAVGAEAERTGAAVLAEGIETDKHRETALALGARYGQGWLFGRPGHIETPERDIARIALLNPGIDDASRTPFEVVSAQHPARRGTKRLLLALSRQIEAQAAGLGEACLILSTFQEARYFGRASAAQYAALAERAALVGALGVGLSESPAPGVRGIAIDHADRLRGEWDVAVLGPHFSGAFVARDLGDSGGDWERRFDFATTYDRTLTVDVARAMLARIASV